MGESPSTLCIPCPCLQLSRRPPPCARPHQNCTGQKFSASFLTTCSRAGGFLGKPCFAKELILCPIFFGND